MTKKHVPYKSTLGFYKIQKFYKNTAHLQKYVIKLGLGKHFSYWNWARRGPQAQPFGSGNFDPHPLCINDGFSIAMFDYQRVYTVFIQPFYDDLLELELGIIWCLSNNFTVI